MATTQKQADKDSKLSAKEETDQAVISGTEVGENIKSLRINRHLSQSALARMAKMHPAQLCNIEQGKRMPSLRTLENIAAAFNISSQDLLTVAAQTSYDQINDRPGEAVLKARIKTAKRRSGSSATAAEALLKKSIIPAHPEFIKVARGESPRLLKDVQKRIELLVNTFLQLEDICGVSKHTTMPLHASYPLNEQGADLLANLVRTRIGIGTAVVYDYPALFETIGMRVIFTDLAPTPDPSKGPQSFSLFDRKNDNAFIFISRRLTRERQIFRLLCEFGQLYLFTAAANVTIIETARNRRFLKLFAARFLMPDTAVRDAVAQLSITPEEWNYELLLRFKQRFGVSAEAFVHRLEEIGLIKPKLRQALKEQIRSYYESSGYHEPASEAVPYCGNERVKDLLLLAKERGADDDVLQPIRDLWAEMLG